MLSRKRRDRDGMEEPYICRNASSPKRKIIVKMSHRIYLYIAFGLSQFEVRIRDPYVVCLLSQGVRKVKQVRIFSIYFKYLQNDFLLASLHFNLKVMLKMCSIHLLAVFDCALRTHR